MARVTGTLTGTALATPGPPVRPSFTTPGVQPFTDQTVTSPSFIASATVVNAPQVAYTGPITITTAGTYNWTPGPGITAVLVDAYGGGGGSPAASGINGSAGGGGGAFARRNSVPVTVGVVYTITVGAAGTATVDGGTSSFTGDSSTQVLAVGGAHGTNTDHTNHPAGGAAASCVGDIKFSGGQGGPGDNGGGGAGASGNVLADGAAGTDNTGGNPGSAGGTGANGGGSGGHGGDVTTNSGRTAGTAPGGGAGGCGLGASGTLSGQAGTVAISTAVTTPRFSATIV